MRVTFRASACLALAAMMGACSSGATGDGLDLSDGSGSDLSDALSRTDNAVADLLFNDGKDGESATDLKEPVDQPTPDLPGDMVESDWAADLLDQITPLDTQEALDGGSDEAGDVWQIEESFELPEIANPDLPFPVLNEIGCHGDDFVELFNRSAELPADLSGYILADGADALHQYVLPSGTIVPPHGRIVIVQKSNVMPGFPFGLQCGADALKLLAPAGELVDGVNLPLMMKGNTYSRLPDGNGEWAESSFTPNAENLPQPDLDGVLFNPMQVISIAIEMPQSSIDALWNSPEVYVAGTFSLVSGSLVQDPIPVGIRIKGKVGSLQTLDQKPALKVKFNFSDAEMRFLGLKKLTLNNMVQDPSMVHEVLAYRIFTAFDIPSPRTGYAQLTINGELYGLYLVLETYDDVTLSRYFLSTQHLYEGDSGIDVVPEQVVSFQIDDGSKTTRSDLAKFALVATKTVDDQWMTSVETVSDLPGLLRMWAVEEYIGHWDGYAPTINNYYLHSTDDGVFTMLPSGTDQTFVDYREYHDGNAYLFSRCMAIPDCNSQYEQTLEQLIPVLDSLGMNEYIEELSQYLTPWAQADPRKPYTMDDVELGVSSTQDFLNVRRVDLAEAIACWLDPVSCQN